MKRLLVFASTLAVAVQLVGGTVVGKVNFVSKPGHTPVVNETLVWLEPLTGKAAAKAPGRFQMVTRGKTLVPHVLAVPVGSTVEFPNDDPISHNLFSLSSASTFDLGLYRRGAGKSHTFETAGIVNVYCNVHPTMSAVIHVMPTAYYAFTDAAGNYSIPGVPAGKYRLVAWNEQAGQTMANVDVTAAGGACPLLMLDTTKYKPASHTNKVGKPYTSVPRDY